MKWDWDEMFGSEYFIVLKNEERKYFVLEEINPAWEISRYYSKTNLWYKRTTAFWEGNTIVKVIVEQKRVVDEGKITYHSYEECDTRIVTEQREWILPLTSKGKKKKVTAANILNITPFGCVFHFHLDTASGDRATNMAVNNPRNCQTLAIGEVDRVKEISNNDDFRVFMEEYIATCPDDYFDKAGRLKTAKRVTVKYHVGDVFRIEVDRFRYCYGIITGEIRKMIRWEEMPERHSFYSLMMVPLMVRYYNLVTTDGTLTVEDLKNVPLGYVDICGDNDIIWGTHPIIGHRELEAEDLEFNLICTRIIHNDEHSTVFTGELFMADGLVKQPQSYHLYVEWGTANVLLPSDRVSAKLEEYLKEYHSPHGGVSIGIRPTLLTMSEDEKTEMWQYKYNLLEDINRDMRNELFACLGLHPDAGFDEFAVKFQGLTKQEILEKMRR